jgi:hypothetical protein
LLQRLFAKRGPGSGPIARFLENPSISNCSTPGIPSGKTDQSGVAVNKFSYAILGIDSHNSDTNTSFAKHTVRALHRPVALRIPGLEGILLA